METDHEYLSIFTDIVKAMVPSPDDVQVAESTDERGILLTIDVKPEDRGKIIGKLGVTAQALRTIAHCIGGLHHAQISIVIKG